MYQYILSIIYRDINIFAIVLIFPVHIENCRNLQLDPRSTQQWQLCIALQQAFWHHAAKSSTSTRHNMTKYDQHETQ